MVYLVHLWHILFLNDVITWSVAFIMDAETPTVTAGLLDVDGIFTGEG